MAIKHHLADLTRASTDGDIARAITGYLLNEHNPAGPFKLAYEFDAKNNKPPHHCDRIVNGHTACAIERSDKEWCRTWLLIALNQGLYVQRYAPTSGWHNPIAGGSIKNARQTIETRERMADFDAKRTMPMTPDDEIPF
jgi:hypothetical protein